MLYTIIVDGVTLGRFVNEVDRDSAFQQYVASNRSIRRAVRGVEE